MKTIQRVLVANRGEIALRIFRTCRRLGLSTVAVYSDADANSPHVRFADEAVRLGPAPSAESYLRIDAVVGAAKATGADAVHPGYGFLAENPAFAEACEAAGLTFIGPTAKAIRAMGLKREAKALVAARGVPLVPGFDGGDQKPATLKAKALELGLPVIFKPSAGGGGKGMRIAREPGQVDAAIGSAQREATASFGDATLIIEKYLERPRHIEVQVLGDTHGNLVHLFERECSIQRRHQKIVEETPSTALSEAQRTAMGAAAVAAAKAVDYTNAGTVEFILDAGGTFYFSEMNTRLQVEHRVTEQVLGLDLVELQLRVAQGEALPFSQADLKPKGHSVEVRLYAEDPKSGFLPCVGPVLDWQPPQLGHLLVDTGLESGGEVSMHYDPMIAKLVTWGETREASTALLARALDGLSVLGVTTNRAFLARLLRHPAYLAGALHTQFLDEHGAALLADPKDSERDRLAALAATVFDLLARRSADGFLPSLPRGFRNSRFCDQRVDFTAQGEALTVEYRELPDGGLLVRAGGREETLRRFSVDGPEVRFEDGGGRLHRTRVVRTASGFAVHTADGAVDLAEVPRFPAPQDAALKGGLIAPMPGKVVRVLVKDGDVVKQGQALLVLEAMKMEQTTSAPSDGVVAKVLVREGDQVTSGQVLVTMAE